MQLRRLIASGLLLAVFMAPALGLALCNTAAAAPANSGCSRCAMANHAAGLGATLQPSPAPQLPVAPCCQRKAPLPALGETSAQVVSPLQIALLPSASPVASLPARPVVHVESLVPPPLMASPLSLLCSLLI
jgi:hypothetical protein